MKGSDEEWQPLNSETLLDTNRRVSSPSGLAAWERLLWLLAGCLYACAALPAAVAAFFGVMVFDAPISEKNPLDAPARTVFVFCLMSVPLFLLAGGAAMVAHAARLAPCQRHLTRQRLLIMAALPFVALGLGFAIAALFAGDGII